MIIICIVILAALILTVTLAKRLIKPDDTVAPESSCSTCSGNNARCEQACMMEASIKEPEYFDDEELDRYKGRDSDAYTDNETEEFREVLYTMRPEEAREWNRSLILRGINVPDQLKDELILIITSCKDIHNTPNT